jgi:hypothetical protein
LSAKRFDFFGGEEEAVSGLAQHSEVPARVILEDDRKVEEVIEIAFDGFHDGNFSLQRNVHDVGGFLRPEAHTIAGLDGDAKDGDRLDGRVFGFA